MGTINDTGDGSYTHKINDTGDGSYTHKRLQGQVSDGDTYAMGGIAGHAGVFSTLVDMARFASTLLGVWHGWCSEEGVGGVGGYNSSNCTRSFINGTRSFINGTTLRLFTEIYNSTQSSRALGWGTY